MLQGPCVHLLPLLRMVDAVAPVPDRVADVVVVPLLQQRQEGGRAVEDAQCAQQVRACGDTTRPDGQRRGSSVCSPQHGSLPTRCTRAVWVQRAALEAVIVTQLFNIRVEAQVVGRIELRNEPIADEQRAGRLMPVKHKQLLASGTRYRCCQLKPSVVDVPGRPIVGAGCH